MIAFNREPTAKQSEYLDLDNLEQCFGGAKGGGKTITCGMKLALLSWWYPGNRLGLFRRHLSDLKDTTLLEFFNTVPDDMVLSHNKQDRQITIKSRLEAVPSTIIYRGLGELNGKDWEKVKSMSLGGFAIDEPSEVGLEVYMQLRSQLRWTLPKEVSVLADMIPDAMGNYRPKYMAMLFTNPEPGWVKDRFVNPEKRPPECEFIQSLPTDNPHLPPGYVESLMKAGYPPEWIAKYMRGDWSAGEGQVFTMYDEKIHVLKEFSSEFLKRGFSILGALDHGMTGVTACTMGAYDQYGNEVNFTSYYERDRLISYHAREIKNMWFRWGIPGPQPHMLIDPSTISKTLQKEDELGSVLDEYAGHGIVCVPAWNRIEVGIDAMKEQLTKYPLHFYPWYHTMANEANAPATFFYGPETVELRKEIEEFKKLIKVDGKIEWSGSDHALDTWRYRRNSKPRRPQAEPADVSKMGTATRVSVQTHAKWAKAWDKKSGKVSGSFFHNSR
jgi:hypothetical protein